MWQYRLRLDLINKRTVETNNITGNDSSTSWLVDLHSHLRDIGIKSKQTHYIDLFEYYDERNGWSLDKTEQVISLLGKVRFFNRFDEDQLKCMLKKVTLKRINKN